MPTTVRAVRISAPGGPEVLTLGEIQVRDPGPTEVLIEIAAAGLNRADILQRKGVYPAPKGTVQDVPGLEYAGHVASAGSAVQNLQVGDRVMGIASGGAMATHIVAHEAEVARVPEGMDLTTAAAVPEVFMTAHDAIFSQGGARMGQSVLIHACGSGVGTAALQLCRAAGVTSIGTSRKTDKLERCAELGLDHGICSEDGSFAKALRALPAPAPSVLLDTIGARYLDENIKAIGTGGRIVVIGLLGGAKGELNMGLLLARRAQLIGSVLRSRSLAEKIQVTSTFESQVVPLLADGRVKPIIEDTLPMAEVADAHARLESDDVFGKLVLRW